MDDLMSPINLVGCCERYWRQYGFGLYDSAIKVGYEVEAVRVPVEDGLSSAALSCLRLRRLPALLRQIPSGTQVVVTDVDVEHVAMMPCGDEDITVQDINRVPSWIETTARSLGVEREWIEGAWWPCLMGIGVKATPAGIAFADRVVEALDKLVAQGYGDRWYVDQRAVNLANPLAPPASVRTVPAWSTGTWIRDARERGG